MGIVQGNVWGGYLDPMQSVCVAVVIWAILVDTHTHTHRQLLTDYTINLAS